jgi:hypothetical protein
MILLGYIDVLPFLFVGGLLLFITPFHPISEPFNGDLKRLTQKANS